MLDMQIEWNWCRNRDANEGRILTHHFIELVHLCINRKFFPRLQHFLVLSSVRNICEGIDVVFLVRRRRDQMGYLEIKRSH